MPPNQTRRILLRELAPSFQACKHREGENSEKGCSRRLSCICGRRVQTAGRTHRPESWHAESFQRRQNDGESSAKAVNISSLPSSMHTVSTTRPKALTASKFSKPPTW